MAAHPRYIVTPRPLYGKVPARRILPVVASMFSFISA